MGVGAGPNTIVTDGLILYYDIANKKSYIPQSTNLNMSFWNLGSGSVTGYVQNGGTSENERVMGTNPMGESVIVWETSGNTISDADGGWNTSYHSVDNDYTYRFSIWVKRISDSGGGTFYFGLNPAVVKLDDTSGGNPYWNCSASSSLTKDQWYLYVGHCFYHSYTGTTRHDDTGIYTTSGRIGNINGCNIGVDCKWNPSTTSSQHRTYHYYCTDGITQLQFYDPRMDKCDGIEPTIQELLTKSGSGVYDIIEDNNGVMPLSGSFIDNSITFNGIDQYIKLPSQNDAQSPLTGWGNMTGADNNDYSISIWVKTTQIVGSSSYNAAPLVSRNSNDIYAVFTIYNGYVYFSHHDGSWQSNIKSTTMVSDGEWHHVVFVNHSNETGDLYIDSIKEINGLSSSITASNYFSPDNIGYGYSNRYLNGSVSMFQAYDKALSQIEVVQNYNSQKYRFI